MKKNSLVIILFACWMISFGNYDLLANEIDLVKTEEGEFTVSSDRALFERNDDLSSKLILSGNVEITRKGMGKIKATEDVHLALINVDGKKVLRDIETSGEAILTYKDLGTEMDHVLHSYGTLRIDHQKMEAKLQSPKNINGRVIEGKQIFFKDAKGEILGDKGFIKYEYADQKIVLVRIVLQGNVKIANRLEQAEDSTKSNQYILADRVDFIPESKEMIFKAAKGQRVLLFDKANHLEVSTSSLKLIRDKATRKETVQGIGDVRFSFVDGELDQLRRHFSFDKID